ncbi:guanine nucleotide binding protein, alpha subunit [Zopfochytrium polystomum]|nr:guanine nucleotide binding protein, alpha subunit [Zopfochytrium polystomum]
MTPATKSGGPTAGDTPMGDALIATTSASAALPAAAADPGAHPNGDAPSPAAPAAQTRGAPSPLKHAAAAASATEAAKISRQIDREMKAEAKAKAKSGDRTADAGKSTILKQLKLHAGADFSPSERDAGASALLRNLISTAKTLVHGMRLLGIPYGGDGGDDDDAAVRAREAAAVVERFELDDRVAADGEREKVPTEVVDALQVLWADLGVQWCAKRGNEFGLPDSCEFLMTNYRSICSPTFTPTNHQLLHARQPTLGASETALVVSGRPVTVIDVGGQRRFRAKWAPFFDGVSAIIFVAALSSYDQVLGEDEEEGDGKRAAGEAACEKEEGDERVEKGARAAKQKDAPVNRMKDSLSAFTQIANHPLLHHIPIILFLNKTDLFSRKIKTSPINAHFPDYQGGPHLAAASQYFRFRFVASCTDPNKPIVSHYTWATDTAQMKKILEDVTDAVLIRKMRDIGLS